MRKYSSNLAFVDLLFNLLVGFTSLFVIAFLLINPIAKQGVVDPPIILMIEMEWSDDSKVDIDLHVKGPDGKTVFYGNKSNGYITLKRDDLGASNDTFVINGKRTVVRRNYEITTMTVLPDGDYIVNAHFFSRLPGPEDIRARMTQVVPFRTVYEGQITLDSREERTLLVFKVKNGKILDTRTDVQVTLRHRGK